MLKNIKSKRRLCLKISTIITLGSGATFIGVFSVGNGFKEFYENTDDIKNGTLWTPNGFWIWIVLMSCIDLFLIRWNWTTPKESGYKDFESTKQLSNVELKAATLDSSKHNSRDKINSISRSEINSHDINEHSKSTNIGCFTKCLRYIWCMYYKNSCGYCIFTRCANVFFR